MFKTLHLVKYKIFSLNKSMCKTIYKGFKFLRSDLNCRYLTPTRIFDAEALPLALFRAKAALAVVFHSLSEGLSLFALSSFQYPVTVVLSRLIRLSCMSMRWSVPFFCSFLRKLSFSRFM